MERNSRRSSCKTHWSSMALVILNLKGLYSATIYLCIGAGEATHGLALPGKCYNTELNARPLSYFLI